MSNRRTCGHPLLLVLSAPSGAGKTTLAARLLARRKDMVRSVSCTTRRPRGTEVDGRDYYFISRQAFGRKMANGDFMEWAEVHGNQYGTLRKTVEDALRKRLNVLLVIDVQGAGQIRACARRMSGSSPVRKGFVDVFIKPPSLDVLNERLTRRSEDTPATIRKRLKNARREMRSAKDFKYAIVNDDLDTAVRELRKIVDHETGANI